MSKRRGPKKPGKQSGKGAGRQPQQPAKSQQQAKPQQPAKPQQQGRPAPPVQQRAPVGKPAQKCPLPVRKPCDVVKLVLEGRYAKHTDATDSPEGQKKTSLTCDRPLRSTPLGDADKKAAGKQVAILLSRYDLVMDLIAGFVLFEKNPETSANIKVSFTYEGKCSTAQHPVVRMRPVTNVGKSNALAAPPPAGHGKDVPLEHLVWPNQNEVELNRVFALASHFDLVGGADAFTKFARFIMFFANFNKSVDLELWGDSCGTPVAAPKVPNRSLNCLVRVFRDVTVGLVIKLPPAKKVTETAEGMGSQWDLSVSEVAGIRSRTQSEQKMGWTQHGAWMGDKASKSIPANQFGLALKLNEFEITLLEDGTREEHKERMKALAAKAKDGARSAPDRARAAAELARYQLELASMASLKHHVEVAWRDLVRLIQGVRAAIEAIPKVLKKAPQLGFKIEYECSFLAGSLAVSWTRTSRGDKPVTGALAKRYAPLQGAGKIEIKLSIVDIKLIASFGAKLDLGPVASAEARISLWAGLAAEWGIALATHEDQETKLEVKSTGGAKANVQATLGPITVWKREIGIESGIVVEGKLAYKGSEGKFEWAIVVRTLPTGWYFTASSARTRAAKTTVHQIFAPKQIYKADGKIGG